MAGELPLPKQVFAHGWLLFEDNKNEQVARQRGAPRPHRGSDGRRCVAHFLLREITFGQDGSFSYDALIQRYNADLANGLGNLASRTLTMIKQYRNGVIPDSAGLEQIAEIAKNTVESVMSCFERFEFSRGLELTWAFLTVIDKFNRGARAVEAGEGPGLATLLDETLYHRRGITADCLRLLYPVMPETTAKIWSQLGIPAAGRLARHRPALGAVESGPEHRRHCGGLPASG